MAIDASIPLQSVAPQMPSPMATLGQIMSLKGMQQQQALQQQAIESNQALEEERRQQVAMRDTAIKQDAALRALFQQPTLPSMRQISSIVGPERGTKIAEGLATLQKTSRGDYVAQQEDLRKLALGMDALTPELRAEVYPAVRSTAVSKLGVPETELPPQYDEKWFQQAKFFGQEADKGVAIDPTHPVVDLRTGRVIRLGEPSTDLAPIAGFQTKTGEPVFTRKSGGTFDAQGQPTTAIRVPNQTVLAQQNARGEFDKLMAPEKDAEGNEKPNALLRGIIAGTVNPVDTFANLRTDPYAKGRFKAQILAIDPLWNENRYKVRQNYTSGTAAPARTVNALKTAANHMGLLNDLADAVDNGNLQAINSIVNKVRTQFGKSGVTNYQLAAAALGSEIAAALKGSNAAPTDPEINTWQTQLSSARSATQMRDGLRTIATVLAGRMSPLQEQWQETFGPDNFFPLVKEYGRKQFEKVGVSLDSVLGPQGSQDSGAPAGKIPDVKAPVSAPVNPFRK